MQIQTSTTQEHLTAVEIEHRLQQHGYRITGPRSIIVDAVIGHDRPFTAEQLVTELAGGQEAIGRATIYRTLELLASMDILTRIVSPEGNPLYISGTPGHRHHLLCEACGTTITITNCPMTELIAALEDETHFVIRDHTLEVFGICPSCQKIV